MIALDRFGFIAHHTEGDVVERFLRDLSSDNRRDWYSGGCLLLPRWRVSTQRDSAVRLEPLVDFLIADPDTRRLHLAFDGRGRGRDELAYLAESDPLANRQRFVNDTLQAQVANGRDSLVSPWLIHGLTPGDDRQLRATVDFAERAAEHPHANDRQVLMGLEATQEVFADEELRNRMIDEIVEANVELPVYLRMTIDPPESRRPYGNEEALAGLRAACEALRANDRAVVLPQSGVVGWLMLPFGATSFGSGLTSSMERNVRPVAGAGGGGGAPPLHWYFSLDLLGPVLAEELPALQMEGVLDCACPYCSAAPPQPGAAFDRNSAALHYLWCCGFLADEVTRAPNPEEAVRSRVANARALWGQVRGAAVPLDGRSRENHLEAWSAAVA